MKISQLFIHPLKSAAAIAVQSLEYEDIGPKYDRQWMVIDANNKFVTQRKFPKMCLLKPELIDGKLRLSADGMPNLDVLGSASDCSVIVWHDQVQATDCGDEAASWVTKALGKNCRIVELNPKTQRAVDPDYAKQGELVSFADGFPTLIASQASLDEFNSHLKTPVDMRRFRPNIVVEGCLPYAEDSWNTIRVGNIELQLVKPCSRCIMPSINPDTSKKEMHINDTLLKTRRRGSQTFFGQNALHSGNGVIRVGDSVTIVV